MVRRLLGGTESSIAKVKADWDFDYVKELKMIERLRTCGVCLTSSCEHFIYLFRSMYQEFALNFVFHSLSSIVFLPETNSSVNGCCKDNTSSDEIVPINYSLLINILK